MGHVATLNSASHGACCFYRLTRPSSGMPQSRCLVRLQPIAGSSLSRFQRGRRRAMAVACDASEQHRGQQQQQRLEPLPLPPPTATLRRYSHARDHARLADICRSVYSGTDDLPDTISSTAAQPSSHLLVASTGGEGGQLDALLCCQQRGKVLWLFGARTAEEKRGCGLAHLLLVGCGMREGLLLHLAACNLTALVFPQVGAVPSALLLRVSLFCILPPSLSCNAQEVAEALAHTLPGVAALLSVTIPANNTMCRLFERRGFRQQRRVVAWPALPMAQATHQQLAAAGRRQPASFLSALPAAAAVADSEAARRLLPHWRRCGSAEELGAALQRLRYQHVQQQQQPWQQRQQQQRQPPGEEMPVSSAAAAPAPAAAGAARAPPPSGADSWAPFLWLPAEYELLPADSPQALQLLELGQVWLLAAPLRPGPEPQPAAATAILVCLGPGSRGMRCAGVVAGSAAAVESAVLHASEVADPQCCRLVGGQLGCWLLSPWLLVCLLLASGRQIATMLCCPVHHLSPHPTLCLPGCRFYVDSLESDHPQLWDSTGGQRTDMLPFYKPLWKEGG